MSAFQILEIVSDFGMPARHTEVLNHIWERWVVLLD
jgi:hypothetical protein